MLLSDKSGGSSGTDMPEVTPFAYQTNRCWHHPQGCTTMVEQLHNKELCELYMTPSIVTVVKYRRLQWANHIARIRQTRNSYRIFMGNFLEDDLLED
jgi:hypothetical protein